MLILHTAVPDKLANPIKAPMVVVVLTDVPEISRAETIDPLVVKEQTAVPDRFSTIPSVNSPDVDMALTDVPVKSKVMPKVPTVDMVFSDVPDRL